MSRARGARGRRGFALYVAIASLVVTAAVVSGAWWLALEDARAGRWVLAADAARSRAELAVADVVARWDARDDPVAAFPVGSERRAAGGAGADSVVTTIVRLSPGIFLVSGRAYASPGGWAGSALGEANTLLALRPPPADPVAAAAVLGAVALDPAAAISGFPAASSAAGCAEDTVAAVRSPDPLGVAALASSSAVRGVPAVVVDSATAVTAAVSDAIAARATVSVGAGAAVTLAPSLGADGRCAVTAASWGDPDRPAVAGDPCASSQAVVRAAGDLSVAGRGQGVVVVAGDLVVERDARLAGLLLVRGALTLRDGASVRGAAVASSLSLGAGASLVRSRCAVAEALYAAAVAGSARGPSWWAPR